MLMATPRAPPNFTLGQLSERKAQGYAFDFDLNWARSLPLGIFAGNNNGTPHPPQYCS